MRIGSMFAGRIDEFEGEAIETKFFMVGVPLVPVASYYLTNLRTRNGFEIPMSGKSVVLGYARIGLWLTALLWGVLGWMTKDYNEGPAVLIGPGLALVAAAFVTWGVGALGKPEQAKRLVLKASTGLGANPAILPTELRRKLLSGLENAWKERYPHYPAREWRDAVEAPNLDAKDTPLLFALASYSSEEALAQRAWQRLSSGEEKPASPYRG